MTVFKSNADIAIDFWNGDGTYSTIVGRLLPTQGYVVALPSYTLVNPSLSEILAWLDANKTITGWLGQWFDTKTCQTHYDVVAIIPERANAERLGRDRGEIAIWDIANEREIRL